MFQVALEKEERAEEQKVLCIVNQEGEICVQVHYNFLCEAPFVPVEDIAKERNSSGRKYTECERCRGEPHAEIVYMTNSGIRYHWKLQCPAISRDVYEKERSEVEGMRACSRCGQ